VVADDAASTVDGVAKSCGGEWENLRETERGATGQGKMWDLVDETSKCAFWFLILYFKK
jgi:hypothetical protein